MQLNETSILSGLKNGNELAYQQVFSAYYELLISYAHKYLESSDQCREVVQKVFVNLYEKRNSLQISSLKPYLIKSVYHGCMDELRTEKAVFELREFHQVFNSDELEIAEREAEIWRAIDALPEKCRQIFTMNRFDGLKNQQIADQLGLSKRTVETQISLALKNLRDKLLFFSWL